MADVFPRQQAESRPSITAILDIRILHAGRIDHAVVERHRSAIPIYGERLAAPPRRFSWPPSDCLVALGALSTRLSAHTIGQRATLFCAPAELRRDCDLGPAYASSLSGFLFEIRRHAARHDRPCQCGFPSADHS